MRRFLAIVFLLCLPFVAQAAPGTRGYYRFPTLHGDTLVFTSQGDLWKVSVNGGQAQALTTHPGMETHPAISPDGKWVAFTAMYEGPSEAYIMPIEGGLPTRLTYDGWYAEVVGWTPQGKVLCATSVHSTLPNTQLVAIDPTTRARIRIPLSQASDGTYDPQGKTLYFTRLAFQGSHTKRYKGGTAQNIWKYADGAPEAVPLTGNYTGTSKAPLFWKDRLYFASDRDGTMNLWSMNTGGGDLKQLTKHRGWDVQSPTLDNGRIVYQLGADLHLYDIATGKDTPLDITLASDFDQTREKWIKNPMEYLSALALSHDGSKVALTARGQVFVAPATTGRFVEVTRQSGVRYRRAIFAPDGKTLYALSDATGETEWVRLPANGVGSAEPLTTGANVLRIKGVVSPDGKWIASLDKNQELWLLDIAGRKMTRIAASLDGDIGDLSWSPDSQWLAYTMPTFTFSRIMLYSLKDSKSTPVTSDRSDSARAAWSPDGKWLYFLSNRTFRSLIGSPWGPRQPEPFFDRQTKIYQVALTNGLRSPFQPPDELAPISETPAKSTTGTPNVTIDLDGIQGRLYEVPISPGNYDNLSVNGSRLFWTSRETDGSKTSLMTLDIGNTNVSPKTLVDSVRGYELSGDGKHLLVQKGNDLAVLDAGIGAPANLDKKVDLSGWTFSLDPRDEWRQMLVEAWRLERDYFYDRKMHGVDWPAKLKQYTPLIDRVRDRDELNDLVAQMVSELSALHTFVVGGDTRPGTDSITPASLGADLTRDTTRGGWRVERLYSGDPDYPGDLAPLAKPGVDVKVGDVIQAINGISTLSVADIATLLRNRAGKQTLLHVREANSERTRDVIVTPIWPGQAADLRYTDWELGRRRRVEEAGKGDIGYVHLRAMGSDDIAQWARDFYPVFNRQGLIIDVRHNGGGNIDSWILEKLMRRAWFYWQSRIGNPTWNMQWAFRGHLVLLCDENTGSDGEAFSEGFRRLGLGKIIGTRTWGGEIWLSFDNGLVDNGIASAAEFGVYGPEGKWLIEGHGVDPDMVVDNLPHATFSGKDAQLDAAIAYLQKEIKEHPVPVPPAPAYPDKSDRTERLIQKK